MDDSDGQLKPNANFLRDHFLREGRLTEAHALTILHMATVLLSTEPNILQIRSPATGASPPTPHLFIADGRRI